MNNKSARELTKQYIDNAQRIIELLSDNRAIKFELVKFAAQQGHVDCVSVNIQKLNKILAMLDD